MVKGNFPKKRKSVIHDEKKFSGKNCFSHFLAHIALYLSAKNQKKLMKQFCTKSKKPYFQAVFGPKFAQKKFFLKIGLRHFLGIAILHHCAKNQKKLMSQSREKLVTDGRTDGRTEEHRLIYRTSEVGPKSRVITHITRTVTILPIQFAS